MIQNTKGTGITYATSPMGADHTAGLTMGRALMIQVVRPGLCFE